MLDWEGSFGAEPQPGRARGTALWHACGGRLLPLRSARTASWGPHTSYASFAMCLDRCLVAGTRIRGFAGFDAQVAVALAAEALTGRPLLEHARPPGDRRQQLDAVAQLLYAGADVDVAAYQCEPLDRAQGLRQLWGLRLGSGTAGATCTPEREALLLDVLPPTPVLMPPLMLAARAGDALLTRLLLQRGAARGPPDATGTAPAEDAGARGCDAPSDGLLLPFRRPDANAAHRGLGARRAPLRLSAASPAALPPPPPPPDGPLHWAVHGASAHRLLGGGAAADAGTGAVRPDFVGVAAALLDAGCAVDAPGLRGRTALALVRAYACVPELEALLQARGATDDGACWLRRMTCTQLFACCARSCVLCTPNTSLSWPRPASDCLLN